jgi:putative protease
MPRLQNDLDTLPEMGIRDVLVGNLGLLIPAREAKMRIHGDFGLNIYNSRSLEVARDFELASATLSFEMTLP